MARKVYDPFSDPRGLEKTLDVISKPPDSLAPLLPADGVEASSYRPHRFLEGGDPVPQSSAVPPGYVLHTGKPPLKYPVPVPHKSKLDRAKEFATENSLWSWCIGLLSFAVLCFVAIVVMGFVDGLYNEDVGKVLMALMLLSLPAAAVVGIVAAFHGHRHAKPVNKRPPPSMTRSNTTFFHLIAQGIQVAQSTTFTQSLSAARYASPDQREALIEEVFEAKTACIKVYAKYSFSAAAFQTATLEIALSRYMNRLTPIETQTLQGLFELYNRNYIGHQQFTDFLVGIIWAGGKAKIEYFAEDKLDQVSDFENGRLAQMKAVDLVSWLVAREQLDHEQAISNAIGLFDELYAKETR